MHVSRNKCELIAECCITGVRPKYDMFSATVKGIDITSIESDYCYIQSRFMTLCSINANFTSQFDKQVAERKYFENATQMFYLALNEGLTDLKLIDRTDEELKQINKYRELEEDLAYV
mgnify:CR=1 FL=1